jgi:type II secretory pathway component GspD/PulD (secretin)
MKKKILILTVMMLAAAGFAREASSSVAQVLEELKTRGTTAPQQTPVVEVVKPEAVPQPAPVEVIKTEAAPPLVPAEVAKTESAASVIQATPDGDSANPLPGYLAAKANEAAKRFEQDKAMDAVTAAWSGMILRDYQLSPVALEKMHLKGTERSTDISAQFPEVEFPEGARAVYRPVLDRLYVLNTRENIARLESILAALEVPQNTDKVQIEIKTRFVEFSEGALEELGFKWENINNAKIAGDWSVLNDTPAQDSSLFTSSLRGSSDVFTQPQSIGASTGGGTTPATGDWTASRLTDNFNAGAGELRVTGDVGPNVDVLIRALDQAAGTDVLSAPSVVTVAGKKASIQVGQTHYFPTDFGVGGSEGTIINVEYNQFTEKLMGVDLSVTPKLVNDSLIEMKLNPKVTELLGWRNYQIAPEDSAYTYYQYRIGMTFEHDPIVARLPIFRHREVDTKVTIQDGSTIGMGGLMTEKTESFSDRVPVLGSIPLVGRLFRSEGERNVKRNLMIFVTAKKISPNGRVVSE